MSDLVALAHSLWNETRMLWLGVNVSEPSLQRWQGRVRTNLSIERIHSS